MAEDDRPFLRDVNAALGPMAEIDADEAYLEAEAKAERYRSALQSLAVAANHIWVSMVAVPDELTNHELLMLTELCQAMDVAEVALYHPEREADAARYREAMTEAVRRDDGAPDAFRIMGRTDPERNVDPYHLPGPCKGCGATDYPLSTSGPDFCPRCACGLPPERD